ncbi:MAG: 16S rRNA (uracil(1498)-N(3))-methyltransferase [Phycisphaeraceae bacterium]|nr:16S rRNA (uracil(1498)-N(3))-methyltransferase [Phycisphaeraceae bacterium]
MKMPQDAAMERVYLPDLASVQGQLVELDDRQAHHLVRVLRLRDGCPVELFDGVGHMGVGRIEPVDDRRAPLMMRVEEVRSIARRRPHLVVAAALPKGPRSEDMVNALAQLGVDCLIPLRTRRSVTDPRPGRVDRFRLAAIEAARQCNAVFLMRIQEPMDFEDAVKIEAATRLIAAPEGEATLPRGSGQEAGTIAVLVGPEGGWTEDELAAAVERRWRPWRLSEQVLRIEQAAGAAAGIIRFMDLVNQEKFCGKLQMTDSASNGPPQEA